ncbi:MULTISPECIES: GNAT family N-acetyltransferase [Pseudonocardia]|uniref:GNAT family N-acetyltransferase n=1 Tax=Pseudonocardia TaxID=1847 RepID=UPI0013028B2E
MLVAGRAEPTGFLVGERRPAHGLGPGPAAAELQSMVVRPGHRGAGIGAELVTAFAAWASGGGARALSVTAAAGNTRASSSPTSRRRPSMRSSGWATPGCRRRGGSPAPTPGSAARA